VIHICIRLSPESKKMQNTLINLNQPHITNKRRTHKMPQTYEVPTWNQTYEMLHAQAQKLRQSNWHPDLIVGVCRGGLVPARILSDLTETASIATIEIKYYTGIAQTANAPELKAGIAQSLEGKKVLLVDDIADTGKSLKLAKEHLEAQGAKDVKVATLYMKAQSVTVPDFYEKVTCSWIVFPWDTKETIREITRTQTGTRAVNREIGKLIKAGLPKQLAQKLLADTQKEP
jgi:uncharacterized protein